MTPAGFPHSDTPGSQLGCQLPRAYRRLLRPSSALDAKASTMCPSQLVTHTTTPTPPTPTHARRTTGRLPVEPDWRCTHQATKEPHTHPTITGQACIHTNKQPHPHHPTPPHVRRHAPKDQAGRCGYKMLASTIQISNNNPTPPTTARIHARRQQAGSTAPKHRTEAPGTTTNPTQTVRRDGSDSSEPQQCAPTPQAHPVHTRTDTCRADPPKGGEMSMDQSVPHS